MDYSPSELEAMSDDEARSELTVEQYERREKLLDLLDEAAENEQELAADEERVEDLVVHADPEALGTEVDVFGNDLLVQVESDDPAFRAVAEELDDEFGDIDETELETLGAEETDRIAEALQEMLDLVLVRWNGTDWDGLARDKRDLVLHDCREKWGVDGLLLAWVEIADAVQTDREDKLSVVDSFRGAERRGRR